MKDQNNTSKDGEDFIIALRRAIIISGGDQYAPEDDDNGRLVTLLVDYTENKKSDRDQTKS